MNILMDFVFFSIIGFISEVIYCSLNKRKSGKALYGPWCPLYGLGGLLIISIVSHVPENMFIIYLVSVLVASFTEYLVSVILGTWIYATNFVDRNIELLTFLTLLITGSFLIIVGILNSKK